MQRTHRLLMIGVDHQALEALPAHVDVTVVIGANARDIGLPVTREGVRMVFADESRGVDPVLNALYRNGLTEFDAVYAHDDMSMMTAAAVGAVLGARAVPARTVALFRDKFLQKQRLRQAGVIVARHELIEDIRELPTGWQLPFERAVVKPVAGQATQSTFVVSNTAEVERISRDCRARNVAARTFVVEEFIDGEELFADGIVSGGRMRFVALGRYPQNCLKAVNDRSPVRTFTLDPISDKAYYNQALPVVEKSLATLGLADGIFHMELFSSQYGVVFSECAARRAGGPIRDQVRYKFGVDLAELGTMALLGSIEDITLSKKDGCVAGAFLPLVEGTLLDHPSEAELLTREGVVGARIFVPRGLRTAAAGGNTFGRMGEFWVHAPTAAEAGELLDAVSKWFAAKLVVLPLSPTMRELRALTLR
ncbi:ATP-grasp domain-containing protein [Allorhizocola rhizosphaerae]|uniref:ATP-grasp domain-containing protein n=1 Tax=Allorhizocola rhizosphaerae TaxID=1872709 RepID=UPI000E3E1D88|nr:ATP-grasp domain-containing protein [Allorhizocola rhizosphaerae]